jgi:hypothetical protein
MEGIAQVTGYIQIRLVWNLETVQKIFVTELALQGKGQQVISQFFQCLHKGE